MRVVASDYRAQKVGVAFLNVLSAVPSHVWEFCDELLVAKGL